jgi:hypothetical protein
LRLYQPTFYQLRYDSSKVIILLLSPNEHANISIDAMSNIVSYTVDGSTGSNEVKSLTDQLNRTQVQLDSLYKIYTERKQKLASDTSLVHLEKQYQEIVKKQRKTSVKFILEHMNSLASIVALYQKYSDGVYVLNENKDVQLIKIVSDTLKKYYPTSHHVRALVADCEKILTQINLDKLNAIADDKNLVAFPDIALPDISGNIIHLMDIKNKIIILNFWSPEDKFSTKMAMSITPIVEQYKTKGIEVYNVAVTTDTTLWEHAIKTLDLPGIQVIESRQDPLSLKLYNVASVPSSFLIDRKGSIIARDVFGVNLGEKIKGL